MPAAKCDSLSLVFADEQPHIAVSTCSFFAWIKNVKLFISCSNQEADRAAGLNAFQRRAL